MKKLDDIIFKGANLTDLEKTGWVYGVLEVKQMMKEYALEVIEELSNDEGMEYYYEGTTSANYITGVQENDNRIQELKREIEEQ